MVSALWTVGANGADVEPNVNAWWAHCEVSGTVFESKRNSSGRNIENIGKMLNYKNFHQISRVEIIRRGLVKERLWIYSKTWL